MNEISIDFLYREQDISENKREYNREENLELTINFKEIIKIFKRCYFVWINGLNKMKKKIMRKLVTHLFIVMWHYFDES